MHGDEPAARRRTVVQSTTGYYSTGGIQCDKRKVFNL